ncbi:Nuclear export mediator factor Nemf [Smittium mucronatum]|uniref:Nuclear export mediator factor Nemf n=1 Tax=Smittium mucronatum TaxID=133383 RepID=A0A1R0GY48_9FUNG|nr:Nuclear export mediator factor Nemf [Smittium mucronatum]
MKSRFTALDPGTKVMVVIESGSRIHSTEQALEKNSIPSHFSIKVSFISFHFLRKFLNSRRLTGMGQLGFDRIIDLEFASGSGLDSEGSYHLICEFYSSGNIILTDHEYRIISILRTVRVSEELTIEAGKIYNTKSASELKPVTKDQILSVLSKAGPKDSLKKTLGYIPGYSNGLAEHAILGAKIDPNMKISHNLDISEESFKDTYNLGHLVYKLTNASTFADEKKSNEESKIGEIPDEYHSIVLNQLKLKQGITIKEVDSFQIAVDTFYSKIDAIKIIKQVNSRENNIKKKLENMKSEQMLRIQALDNLQQSYLLKAQLITHNLDYVEQVLLLIRSALASGIDWDELKELVQQQKDSDHPIVKNIVGLKLESNNVTVSLQHKDQFEQNPTPVDIDLDLSAFSNAQSYFDLQKQTISKLSRTRAAEEMAYKKAEKKITGEKSLQKKQTNIDLVLKSTRKSNWFEIFLWFISTDGYLVIGGKDMHQNEQIVRKYLKKNDIYVHADTHGSTSAVVINHLPQKSIPISTLIQAGDLAICHSKAWDSKIVTSAYWVNADQVSKKANTGEYLPTGSFMVRGKKNHLPPTSLVYGFGVLFKVNRTLINLDESNPEGNGIIQGLNSYSNGGENFDKLRQKYNLDLVDKLTELEDSKIPSFVLPGKQGKSKPIIEHQNDDQNEPKFEDVAITRKYISSKQRREMKKNKNDSNSQKTDNENISETTEKVKDLDLEDFETKKSSTFSQTAEDHQPNTSLVQKENLKQKEKPKIVKATPGGQKQVAKRRSNKKGSKKNDGFDSFEGDEVEKGIRDYLLKTSSKPGKKEKKKIKGVPPSQKTSGKSSKPNPKINQINDGAESNYVAPAITDLDFEQTEELSGLKNDFLDLLKNLTSNPDPSNPNYTLQFAIPVCAPYSTLTSYKYKIKLTPGTKDGCYRERTAGDEIVKVDER